MSLKDSSEILGGKVSNAHDYKVSAIIEVISFVLNEVLGRAAKLPKTKTLVLQSDVVKKRFCVIINLGKGGYVFAGRRLRL